MSAPNPHAPQTPSEPAREFAAPHVGLTERDDGPRRFTPAFRIWGLTWPPFLYVLVVVLPVAAIPVFVFDTLLMPFALMLLVSTLPLMFLLLSALQRYSAIESWFAEERERQQDRRLPSFVVGVKLTPPRVSRLLRAFEESDDVGLLTLEDAGLRFDGDALQVWVPWDRVESARRRAGDLIGHRSELKFEPPFDGLEGIQFQVREGWTILHTRRRNRELADELLRRPAPRSAPAPPPPARPEDDNPYRSPLG